MVLKVGPFTLRGCPIFDKWEDGNEKFFDVAFCIFENKDEGAKIVIPARHARN